jgi:catechol 2,3-dioxygenase-like lactoylglutathione lyase family enzyme
MNDSDRAPGQIPTIVAPVSRHLSVADVELAIAFYRDILGFDISSETEGDGFSAEAQAVLGPAQIQLSSQVGAYDSTGELRPRGAAILFFQTDDVAAMREAILTRGGTPSELEKVNWIKMRMFEIVDPDGHRIWFGQSFQEPSPPRDPNRQLRRALPQFPLDDVAKGVAYYRDILGFKINHAQDDLGVMDRDDITILLIERTERHTGIGSCYVYINNADTLHAELSKRGANLQGEPVSHPWGLRDFSVLDLEGNQIWFGQTFE